MAMVAVTGAGGFIGAYLTRELAARGHEVLAIDNYLRGRPSRLEGLGDTVRCVEIDVRDKVALLDVLKGVQAVFHLAAVNGTENFYKRPELVLDVGVRGALAVAEACVESGVGELILASSAEVYQTPAVIPTPEDIPMIIPDSLNPRYSYGGSKLISELIAFNYCRDRLAKVQVFRPHNIYGPDMGWKHVIPQLIDKVARGVADDTHSIQLQGDGSETRAFCFVDDAIAGILLMWERGQTMNVYHIGSMEEVPIRSVVDHVAAAMNADIRIVPGPAAEGGTPRRCPDISKMRSIGYEPVITLSEGVRRTVGWYRDNPRSDEPNTLL